MKRSKRIKIKYVYVEPKTEQEKIEQEKLLEAVYFPIFDKIYADMKLKDKNSNS